MSDGHVKVVIAEDRSLIREALTKLLTTMGVQVVGTAVDGCEAVERCRQLDPDVLLMDLKMPRCDGIQALRQIAAEELRTRVIALTDYRDDDTVFAALDAGARGYLTKDSSAEAIVRAIEHVARGDASLEPSIQQRLLDRYREAHGARRRPDYPDGLSNREGQVVRLVGMGWTNREIAEALGVSEGTVKSHLNSIFVKTGLRDRAKLVKFAYDHRLVEAP